jgi:cob(I)alamin adenosyltransferase
MSNRDVRVSKPMVEFLEKKIDSIESELPNLVSFILPGGTLLASILHLSRTITRRAETHVVLLAQGEEVSKDASIYLNRLSDLLFILARFVNHRKKVSDIIWKS